MSEDIQKLLRDLRAFPTDTEARAADVIEDLRRKLAEEKALSDRLWCFIDSTYAGDEAVARRKSDVATAYRKARGV